MIKSSGLVKNVQNIVVRSTTSMLQQPQTTTTGLLYKRNISNKTTSNILAFNKQTSTIFNIGGNSSNKTLFINDSFLKNSNMLPLVAPSNGKQLILNSIRNYSSTSPNQQPQQQPEKDNKDNKEIKESNNNNNNNNNVDKDHHDDSHALKNLSTGEKIKFMLKKYGKLALIVHFGVYFATMGGFYLLFSSGVDINLVLDFLHIPRGAVNPSLGAFAVAFACTKISTFVRTPLTIITVPLLARYLSRGKK